MTRWTLTPFRPEQHDRAVVAKGPELRRRLRARVDFDRGEVLHPEFVEIDSLRVADRLRSAVLHGAGINNIFSRDLTMERVIPILHHNHQNIG